MIKKGSRKAAFFRALPAQRGLQPERAASLPPAGGTGFAAPQALLPFIPTPCGDATKGDILFLEREYPPYTPKRKDEGPSPSTPHMAATTEQSVLNCCTSVANDIVAVCNGQEPKVKAQKPKF